MKLKGSAGIALRRSGMISLMRPAAGGESRKRDSFYVKEMVDTG